MPVKPSLGKRNDLSPCRGCVRRTGQAPPAGPADSAPQVHAFEQQGEVAGIQFDVAASQRRRTGERERPGLEPLVSHSIVQPVLLTRRGLCA